MLDSVSLFTSGEKEKLKAKNQKSKKKKTKLHIYFFQNDFCIITINLSI